VVPKDWNKGMGDSRRKDTKKAKGVGDSERRSIYTKKGYW